MSQLFIRLYLDEDVDVLVAEMIRAHGFDALTTLEAGNLGADDEHQLAFAAEHERAFVTHNRVDFERLAQQYFETDRDHAGILFAVRRPPGEIVRRILVILNQVTWDEMNNQVRYL
jgi:uncharacterized protein with PIN domain